MSWFEFFKVIARIKQSRYLSRIRPYWSTNPVL